MTAFPKALARLSRYGLTLDLEDFLRAHCEEEWAEADGVGIEVLYYNAEQMLLEQIAQVRFPTARHAMKRPVNSKDFARGGICSYAFVTQESVLVPRVVFDVRYLAVQDPDNTQCELAVPLKL